MHRGSPVPGLLPLIKARGLTVQEVARKASVGVETVEYLIRGEHLASSKTLGKLAQALGLPDTRALTQTGW